MSDIVEFLTARLDEDQAAIEAPESWTEFDEAQGVRRVGVDRSFEVVAASTRSWRGMHIARHDPARVLREVEAKRRILERHSPILTCGSMACDGCGWDREDGHHVEDINECPELRDMASVYADHADYEQSWSVGA